MFLAVPLYIIRIFSQYTQQCHMSYWFARKLSANQYDIYNYCVYCEKLLIMDRETARNM